MDWQPESRVRNYLIKDVIARGGMGIIWRAWDLNRNEFVAIKAVANDLLADPDFKYRFLDEMRRHSRLSHPNIVPILDVFEEEGQSCFVMRLIDGVSVTDLLESRPHHRMPAEEAIPIIQDVLQALDYAHRRGIVHRDVKPSNILVDKKNRAHLIDFGIALAIGEKRRTRTGQTVGTPLYMSPEQIVRPKTIDHRTDVYSIGCVLYEMLSGRPPFLPSPGSTGDTDFTIKQAHINEIPVPARRLAPTIPKHVDRVIGWALEKDPEKRVAGCQEFAKLLAQSGAGGESDSEITKSLPGRGRGILKKLGQVLRVALIFVFVFTLIYTVIFIILGANWPFGIFLGQGG